MYVIFLTRRCIVNTSYVSALLCINEKTRYCTQFSNATLHTDEKDANHMSEVSLASSDDESLIHSIGVASATIFAKSRGVRSAQFNI